MNGGIIMAKSKFTPKFNRLMTMGVITIAAVLTELVLQILCYGFDAFSVRSGLRWWGIVPIALIMLYLLFSLTAMQTPDKKQLAAWGLGVAGAALPFAQLAVGTGTPYIVMSVLCVLLAIGAVVFQSLLLARKRTGHSGLSNSPRLFCMSTDWYCSALCGIRRCSVSPWEI